MQTACTPHPADIYWRDLKLSRMADLASLNAEDSNLSAAFVTCG